MKLLAQNGNSPEIYRKKSAEIYELHFMSYQKATTFLGNQSDPNYKSIVEDVSKVKDIRVYI